MNPIIRDKQTIVTSLGASEIWATGVRLFTGLDECNNLYRNLDMNSTRPRGCTMADSFHMKIAHGYWYG